MATHRVDFPTHKRPTTDVNILLLLGGGAVLTVVIYAGLWTLGTEGGAGFVRDLFIGRFKPEPDRLLFCGLITFMWSLSMMNAVLKMLRIRNERKIEARNVIPQNLDFTKSQDVLDAYHQVSSHESLATSIALTRVSRVLAVWINTESFERTVQAAKEESDLDAFASDSSYRMNRLFIWALPVLGFIGTVYGVSLAVSNFAGFLSGAVTPEGIKTQVGLITTGLGVAFYTTLLGLIFATIAAFASLLTERSEEAMLDEINELVEDRLILRMPVASEKFPLEEMVNAIRDSIAGIQSQFKFPMDELAQAIDAGFRRLPNPDRYEEVFSRAIAKAGDLINQKYDEFTQIYERRAGELGMQLSGRLEGVGNAFSNGMQRLAQQLNEQTARLGQTLSEMEGRQSERLNAIVEEMRRLAQQLPEDLRKGQERYLEMQAKTEQKTMDRFEELTEQITTAGKEQSEQFGEAHERYLAAISDLDRREIARWEKMVAEFNQLAVRLSESFKQSVAALDSASARYSERIQASVEALNEQLEAVKQLGSEIDKVLHTTQTMEGTLRTIGSSDEFRQTLSSLRTHLTASDELLKQLSKPRKVVFQEARVDQE